MSDMGAVASSVFVAGDEMYDTVEQCPVNQHVEIRYVIKDWMGHRTLLPVTREMDYLSMNTVSVSKIQIQYPMHRYFIKNAKGRMYPTGPDQYACSCPTVLQTCLSTNSAKPSLNSHAP